MNKGITIHFNHEPKVEANGKRLRGAAPHMHYPKPHIDDQNRVWTFDPEFGWTCGEMWDKIRKALGEIKSFKSTGVGQMIVMGTGGSAFQVDRTSHRLFIDPEAFNHTEIKKDKPSIGYFVPSYYKDMTEKQTPGNEIHYMKAPSILIGTLKETQRISTDRWSVEIDGSPTVITTQDIKMYTNSDTFPLSRIKLEQFDRVLVNGLEVHNTSKDMAPNKHDTPQQKRIQNVAPAFIELLKEDKDYRESFMANIAMAYKDEFHRQYDGVNETKIVHSVGNQAAKNFIDLLTNTKNTYHD